MKSLELETNDALRPEQPAELVMETVSMVTRAIRHEMRRHRPTGMSMQQFRALRVVQRHPGESLSVAAAHLGLTTASASKLVDALVKLGLVDRTESPDDRRKVVLDVTESGRHALEAARTSALGRLAEVLAALDKRDCAVVVQAMGILRRILAEERGGEGAEEG